MYDDQSRNFQEIKEDINRVGIELLLTDASVAQTFLFTAEHSHNQETVDRNIRNARTAYNSIQKLRLKHLLSDKQTSTLELGLSDIKSRLIALGDTF